MLKDVTLFSCLEDKEIEFLKNAASKKKYSRNAIVFSEGDESDCLYIIYKGKVKAVVSDENGKEVILNIHGPGEYFGEMSLIDGEPRSATIITKEVTELLMITRQDFKKILTSSPDMCFNLLKGLTRLLRRATRNIENLAFLDVYGRVISVIKQHAEKQGDHLVVTERLTHKEIANMVGASREMVSRILKDLEIGGYIAFDKKQITIKKKIPATY